uniref:Ubiquitin carboxyl-terminal hydrolase 47 C-terminal domain-containing protein n=1 Tax=Amphimedon queenslandica TaxID=400682 RepID=A0A1X7SH41_AMPQE
MYMEILKEPEKMKLPTQMHAELSGVPVDAISVATYLRSFPAVISHLDIKNELEWNQASLYDADGDVIYYKDNRKQLKEITTEERAGFKMTESKSVAVYGIGSLYDVPGDKGDED